MADDHTYGPQDGYFTDEQKATVAGLLDEGMSPADVAGYMSRLNDLSQEAEIFIRGLAENILDERETNT
jgi:hypothetical protein